jgi:hypothetical protein
MIFTTATADELRAMLPEWAAGEVVEERFVNEAIGG